MNWAIFLGFFLFGFSTMPWASNESQQLSTLYIFAPMLLVACVILGYAL